MGLLFAAHMMSASDVSCDARMRHGPKGLFKGVVAMLGAVAAYRIASDLKDVSRRFWAQGDTPHYAARRDVILNPWVAACALISLSYVSWTFSTSSLESLKIYFDDSLDDEANKPTESREQP